MHDSSTNQQQFVSNMNASQGRLSLNTFLEMAADQENIITDRSAAMRKAPNYKGVTRNTLLTQGTHANRSVRKQR